jgi:hypothetical protein
MTDPPSGERLATIIEQWQAASWARLAASPCDESPLEYTPHEKSMHTPRIERGAGSATRDVGMRGTLAQCRGRRNYG